MSTKMKFEMPHVYIIFLLVMVLVVVLSHFIPAGEFVKILDPVTNKMKIDPTQFHYLENVKSIGFIDFFTAVHQGIVNAGHLIVLVLMASGAIYVLDQSGSLAAGIHALLRISAGKEKVVIIALSFVMSLMGAIGFGEGALPFFPLIIAVIMGLGYDRITGFAVGVLSVCAGFSSGFANLYTTGIAQDIVGLPLFSGIGFRVIAFLIFTSVVLFFILSYANKIKKNPKKSYCRLEYTQQLQEGFKAEESEELPFTFSRKLALFSLLGIVALSVYGATKLRWGMPQISGLYVMYAVFLGIVLRISPNKVAKDFGMGAALLLPPILAIGLAGSVMVLMQQAKIVDTMVFGMSEFLQGKSEFVTLFLVFISIVFFNFFVISGSGKALILMPMLGPLAIILGINQQVMVLLFQFGDGFTNYLWPTAGALMAALGMCKVDYTQWFRFSIIPIIVLHVVAFVLIVIANYMKLGPF